MQKPTVKHWLLLLLLGGIWGSSFKLISVSTLAFSPTEVGTLRLLIAMLAFLPVTFIYRRQIDWSKWPTLLAVGALGSAFPFILFPFAEQHIDSSVAGILNSLTPVFTLVWGVLFFGKALQWRKVLGVSMGLIGATAIIMTRPPVEQTVHTENIYGLFIVLATICYGLTANLVSSRLSNMNGLTINAAAYALVSGPSWIYLFSTDVTTDVTTHPEGITSLCAVLTLGLLGTFLASIIYFKLILEAGALFGSMVAFLMALVSLFVGAYFGEPLSAVHFVSAALILSGIYAISKS